MNSLGFTLRVELTLAGEERARLVAGRGERSIFGNRLPIRELSVDKDGVLKTYLIGPVREGGREQRLGWVEIGILMRRPSRPEADLLLGDGIPAET